MVITGTNVTFDDLLKMEIDPKNLLNDELLNEMNSYGSIMPQLPLDDINDIDITIDLSDCNNWNMAYMITSIDDTWKTFKKSYLETQKAALTATIKNLKNTIKNILISAYNNVKDLIISLYKQIKMEYNNIIKFFESNYRKIVILFKKIKGEKLTSDDKKKAKQKIINELKRLGQDILDMFGIYIIIDTLKGMWAIIKNLFGCKKDKFNAILKSNNEIKELLDNQELKKSKRIGSLIETILNAMNLFGILLATVAAINDCIRAQREADEKYLNDATNDINSENKKIQNYKKQNLSDLSLLENLFKNDNNDNDKTENIISICPVYDTANASIITNNNGYIIEFGKDLTHFKINVNINEDITLDKIIGYINDIPIKSKIEGNVTHITDRHIVINKNEKNNEETLNDINSLLASITDSTGKTDIENEMSSIAEKMTNMNNIEILIKDYFNLIYKPIIYGKSNNDVKSEEISEFNKILNITENNHKQLKDKFENDIKQICSADNVTAYAEKNNLNELKDIILNKKYAFIDDIFNNINDNFNKSYYISKDKDDYIMSDYYLEFILSEHLDNPYHDKLFNIIKNFYLVRFELENKNKNELIKKFNNYLNDDKIENKSFNIIKNDIENGKYENIKKYLDELYPATNENKLTRINTLSNLYTIINEIPNNKSNNNNENTLRKITQNECIELLKFINDLQKEYNSYKDVINNISNLYNIINWPQCNDVYVNNYRYEHYLFTSECLNSNKDLNNYENASEDDYNDQLSGISKAGVNSLAYWMKYCSIATLVNCTSPIYWATGLLLLGIPIPMPIILIPMTYINGPVSTVIGLGMCGIAIAPMMLVVNMSDECGAALFAINMIIDMAKQMLIDLKNIQYKSVAIMCEGLIKTINEKIKNTEDEIKNIKQQIALYKNL